MISRNSSKRLVDSTERTAKEVNGEQHIFCDFKGKTVNFFGIASKGTCSLALFYFWLTELDKVSLVFIDEFDSFYHNKLARHVVKEVLKRIPSRFSPHIIRVLWIMIYCGRIATLT